MFSFTLFNVGHGFCGYAVTPNGRKMLFDCGYDTELQFYPSRYFRDRNIHAIDDLFLSHFDQDHVCDLPNLRNVVEFGTIVRNGALPAAMIRRQKQTTGGVSNAMESALFMHENWTTPLPFPPDYGGVTVTTFANPSDRFTDMNNLSVVTFLEFDGLGMVIPGDLESAGWRALLENQAFRDCLSRTNVFIASHHGRNEGYCENVFDYCTPDIVILSDKGIIHDTQEHDYTRHATGVRDSSGGTRRVLTTRCDGHILITKERGCGMHIQIGLRL